MDIRYSALELESRRRIYDFILNHPGIHFSALCRRLNVPKTTMFYHINYLKKISLLQQVILKNILIIMYQKNLAEKKKNILDFLEKKFIVI